VTHAAEKKHETTGSADLFRARLEQIINMRHELVQLAGKIDWEWIDGEIAPLYGDKGRPAIETRFVMSRMESIDHTICSLHSKLWHRLSTVIRQQRWPQCWPDPQRVAR
jgi:hypothetical protein